MRKEQVNGKCVNVPTREEVRNWVVEQKCGWDPYNRPCYLAYCKRLLKELLGLEFKPRRRNPKIKCTRQRAEDVLRAYHHYGTFRDLGLSEKQVKELIETVKSRLKA